MTDAKTNMPGCQRAAPWVLLGLIAVPAVELAVIISVGGQIGVWPTVIAVFLTAIIGISLIKPQSRSLMMKAQERMAAGEPPREETFHGICLALAGLMLLFPGFISDTLGFLLLLPPLRDWLYGMIRRRIETAQARAGGSGPAIVEGEFEEIDEDDDGRDGPGGDGPGRDKSMPPPRGGWG